MQALALGRQGHQAALVTARAEHALAARRKLARGGLGTFEAKQHLLGAAVFTRSQAVHLASVGAGAALGVRFEQIAALRQRAKSDATIAGAEQRRVGAGA